MNEFEQNVLSDLATVKAQLATITERTADHPELRADVAEIKGRIRLLEFKAAIAGSAAGAIFAGIVGAAKSVIGK